MTAKLIPPPESEEDTALTTTESDEQAEEPEEDELEDTGCLALARAQQAIEARLEDNAPLNPEEARTFCLFSLAFDLHYLLGRASELADNIDEKVRSFASIGDVIGTLMGGGMPAMDESAFPESPLRDDGDEPNGPSWVRDVLGKTSLPLGKRTILVKIQPEDGGDVDAEHIEAAQTVQQRGGGLAEINAALAQCKRPAKAVDASAL